MTRDTPAHAQPSPWREVDQEELERLIVATQGLVTAACRRQAPGDQVEDCVQAVYQVAARRWASLQKAPAPEAWLLVACRHVCAHARRAELARSSAEQRAARHRSLSSDPADDDPETTALIQGQLDDCLVRLGVRERTAITLHYLCDQSHAQVALSLKMRDDAVRQLCHRALKRLRALLRARGVECASDASLGLLLAGQARIAAGLGGSLSAPVVMGAPLSPWAAGSLPGALAAWVAALVLLVLCLGAGIWWDVARSHLPNAAGNGTAPTAALSAAEERTVGVLSDPHRWHLAGCMQVGADLVHRALMLDADVAVAMAPEAPRAAFLRILRERLLVGYHAGGFPDPAVTVLDDGASLRLLVREGSRYRTGEVIITGTRYQQALSDWLQQPDATEASDDREVRRSAADLGWTVGAPADFNADLHDDLGRSVAAFFDAMGVGGARYDVRLVKQPDGTLPLTIAVSDDGRQARVGAVRISGVPAAADGIITGIMDLAPGSEVSPHLLAQLTDRLRLSGRFVHVAVTSQAGSDPEHRDVLITVQPSALLPPITESLGPEQQLLLEAFRAVDQWGHGDDARDLTCSVSNMDSTGGLTAILSPRQHGLIVLETRGATRLGALLSGERIALIADGESWSQPMPTSRSVTAHLSMAPQWPEHHDMVSLNTSLSTHMDSASGFKTQVHIDPICFVMLMNKATVSRPREDVVRFTRATSMVDVVSDGLPEIATMQGSWLWSVRFRSGAYEHSSALFPTLAPSSAPAPPGGSAPGADPYRQAVHIILVHQAPQVAALLFTPDEATLIDDLCQDLDSALARQGNLASILEGLFAPLDFIPPSAQPSSPTASGAIQRWFCAAQYQLCLSYLADAPWLLDANRSLFLAAAGRDEHLSLAMVRLVADDRAGPLVCLAMAEELTQLALPVLAHQVAVAGLARLDERHWQGDLQTFHLLSPDDSPLRAVLHHPEALARFLAPHHPETLLAALRIAAQSGLDASARQALATVIWQEGVHERMAQQLAALSGVSPSAPFVAP